MTVDKEGYYDSIIDDIIKDPKETEINGFDIEPIETETEHEEENTETFGEKYYDKVDRRHAQILESCGCMCRSNKHGFTDTTRLEAIRELLKDTAYQETYIQTASIWTKGELKADKEYYVVSSHADTVQGITKCFSQLNDKGYYKGTYDNLGTNAAAVIAMLEGDLPDNVIFSFTSDEETGRFFGAKGTVSYLQGKNITDAVYIVLDVTYEGYDEGLLASIENCPKEANFLSRVAKAALESEGENRTFSFVRKSKKAIPENLPKEYIAKELGDVDEAFGYADMKQNVFSLCLPSTGSMHSDYGLTVRQPVFEGYINSLECILYSLTKTHPELIEAKTIEKQTLLSRTKELVEEEKKKTITYTGISNSSFTNWFNSPTPIYSAYDYDDTDYEDDLWSYYGIDIDAINEIIDDNVDIYIDNVDGTISDKDTFVQDMIEMTYPDLLEQLKLLTNHFEKYYYEYNEHAQEAFIEENEEENDYSGYVDELV